RRVRQLLASGLPVRQAHSARPAGVAGADGAGRGVDVGVDRTRDMALCRPTLPEHRELIVPIVELDDVGKTFVVAIRKGWIRRQRRTVRAVDGVTLSIEPGAMVGYIGPNGAGKSTTIKMLTGILVPSSGRIRVAGLDPSRDRVTLARRLGVLFGQRTQLWWDLPLED